MMHTSTYEVTAEGSADVSVTLRDRDGQVVATAQGTKGILHVQNARLWQVRNAYLYQLTVLLVKDGAVTDRYDDKVGIRTVSIQGKNIPDQWATGILEGLRQA